MHWLLIFRIIGILFLVVLLAVLVLLVLLLTVPIRYRLSENSAGKEISGTAEVTWLLHAVHLNMKAESAGSIIGEMKLFGYRWLGFCGLFSQKSPREKESDTREAVEMSSGNQTVEMRQERLENTEFPESEEGVSAEEEGEKRIERAEPADRLDEILNQLSSSIVSWMKAFLSRLKEEAARIRITAQALPQKLQKCYAVLTDEKNRESVSLAKRELSRLVKELFPRNGKGEVCYGTGDPWLTGKILEFLAVLFPVYGDIIEVVPDFERKELKTVLKVEGRISLGSLTIGILRLYNDRGVVRMLEQLRTILQE